MSFAVQSSVCPPVPLSPCLCVPFSPSPPVHVGYVQCVGVVCVAVCGCVCVCVLCVCCVVLCRVVCLVCVCVAHTLKITVYLYIVMYMSASLFLLFDLPQWFHGFLLLAAVSSTFRDFKPYWIYKRGVA